MPIYDKRLVVPFLANIKCLGVGSLALLISLFEILFFQMSTNQLDSLFKRFAFDKFTETLIPSLRGVFRGGYAQPLTS